ncbi:hypothetical protein AMK21_10235 [Streptomyces sp. CB00316]|nr:hypothetical protein AMK21_10235 [Streptomyces sp. CB00316]
MNYLINFSRDRFAQAVELGVQHARRWCTDQGIPWKAGAPPGRPDDPTRMRFTERMVGRVVFGEDDARQAASSAGGAAADIALHLTVNVRGMDRFLSGPEHEAELRGRLRPVLEGADRLAGERVELVLDDARAVRALDKVAVTVVLVRDG